jgi:sulfide dehydrogenase cytochrome subunit
LVYAASRDRATRHRPVAQPREESIVRLIEVVAAVLLAPVAAVAAAQAPDPNLARDLAATCASCHGTDGVSQGGTVSLAGMAKDNIVRKMQEFKSGTKPATIMHQLAKGYSDEQITLIAGWFAAQKVGK